MSETTQILLGGVTVTVPSHTTVNIYAATASEFRGTLEELSAIPGVTLDADSHGSSAWVDVLTPDGGRATLFAPRAMLEVPDDTPSDRNRAAVRHVIDEVRAEQGQETGA